MPANNLIQFRKGVSTDWSSQNPVLKSGEPGYSIDDNTFKIGDGVTSWNDLSNIGSATYSNYVISTGQSSFSTATGYTVGTLELYQNGVKLVNGLDFSATNGSTVTLSGISPSGSILDYRIATVNVCAGSQGGGTTYTAGTGLVLVGTEFNIDGSVMQTGDISTSLAAGTGISLDYDSGTDVLTINATGGGSSYTGGTGIIVDSNNDINIDESVFTTGNLVAGSGLSKSDYTLNVDETVLRTGDLGTSLTAGTGVVFDEVNSDLRINVSFTGHPDVPAASSSNNSGSVVIQDIILDDDGHVTGLGTTNISELFTQGDGMTLTTGTLGDITFAVDPTVVRSGDNISDLNNDVGYITGISNVDAAETTHIQVKNKEGNTLDAGTPVYIDGSVGDNTILEVKKADASDNAKMPAVGILQTQLANNGEGYATIAGFIDSIDTSSTFVSGTPVPGATVYVGVGGGLTTVKPTGNNELIQNVGKLGKTTGDGTMVASCIMRSNDVPNSGNFNVLVSDQITSSNGSFVSLRFGNDNITFPVADGTSGQYLETNGEGVLEWVSADSDANTFVTGVTYSDSTRVVTLRRNDGTNLTAHLDGLATSGDPLSIFVNDSGYINAHPAVDAASSSDNAGQVFIQDLLFDEFGHVTGVSTATASDDNTTYTAGSGLELNGTEFDVRAGDGIEISSDNVAVDNTVVRTTNTYENPSWLTSINANILSGEVPSANLPSYVDDVLEYNGTGNFPATGETGKIYLDTSTNFSYRWGGSVYVQIVDGKATWGGIDGDYTNQSDIYAKFVALDSFDSALSGMVIENRGDIGVNTTSGLQNQNDIVTLSGLIDDLEAVSGAEQSISHSWNNTSAQLVSTLTPGNTVTQQLFEGKLYGDASVTYLKTDVPFGAEMSPISTYAVTASGKVGVVDYTNNPEVRIVGDTVTTVMTSTDGFGRLRTTSDHPLYLGGGNSNNLKLGNSTANYNLNLGGGNPSPSVGFYSQHTINTTSTYYSILLNDLYPSGTSSNIKGIDFAPRGAAGAEYSSIYAYNTSAPVLNGATVGTAIGLYLNNSYHQMGDNSNYGVYSDIQENEDSGSQKSWSIFSASTAPNYFGGTVKQGRFGYLGKQSSNNCEIKYVRDGVYNLNQSGQEGWLKIRLPEAPASQIKFTSTMVKFTVDVFYYLTGRSVTFKMGGYTYGTSETWINPFCEAYSEDVSATTWKAIFCKDEDGYPAVYIHDGNGDDTNWEYPQVYLQDINAGFGGSIATSQWGENWQIAVTGEGGGNITPTGCSNATNRDFSRPYMTNSPSYKFTSENGTNEVLIDNTATTMNNLGLDNDFIVKGLTDDNLLRCDAGNDKVMIGATSDGGTNSKLYVYEINNTNTSNSRTIQALGRQYSTTDGLYYHIGGHFRAEKYLSDSVNDTGYVIGTNSVPVTYGDGTSTTLAEMTAVRANMSLNTTASGVTITNAFDIKCVPSLAGTDNTVTNHYGLFLQTGAGSTTVTNRYGVYQQDPNAHNIFLGPVGCGATNLGSHDLVVNGTSKFDSQVIVETLNVNGEYTFPNTDGTTSGQVLVTDGNGSVAWEDQAGGGTSNVDRATLSLTSGQQTFNVSNGYDTGAIDVYLNGIKLADGTDFTATNGTSFVLTEAAVSGDIVQYTTYDRLTTNGLVSDSGDTMTGDLTINANLAVTGNIDSPQAAKAWVNFNGTASNSPFTEDNGSIRSSLNVTSVVDNGTGDYTVNFDTSFSSKNYAWAGTAGEGFETTAITSTPSPFAVRSAVVNANTFRFYCCYASTAGFGKLDRECVTILFFGELS